VKAHGRIVLGSAGLEPDNNSNGGEKNFAQTLQQKW
jgi:hypothetical protein